MDAKISAQILGACFFKIGVVPAGQMIAATPEVEERIPQFAVGNLQLVLVSSALLTRDGNTPDMSNLLRRRANPSQDPAPAATAHARKSAKTDRFKGNEGKSRGNWPNSCQLPLVRSGPGKPNQRKGQNEKFMNFAHFCEF